MDSLKRILVATDLSPPSNQALARAAQLAEQHGASLMALRVLERVSRDELPEPLRRLSPSDADQRLASEMESALRQAMAAWPRLKQPRTMVSWGRAFLEIVRTARAESADLVVTGAHGAHYLRDLLLGTTAERVIRKGDQPVLVVKRPVERPYQRVLSAVDFSPAARLALVKAATLAPQAHLELLHVYELWNEAELRHAGLANDRQRQAMQDYENDLRRQLAVFLRDAGLDGREHTLTVRPGYPGQVIALAARDRRADLTAVGTHGLGGVPYILLGSVAEHVLREAPCDVLTCRPPDFRFELP